MSEPDAIDKLEAIRCEIAGLTDEQIQSERQKLSHTARIGMSFDLWGRDVEWTAHVMRLLRRIELLDQVLRARKEAAQRAPVEVLIVLAEARNEKGYRQRCVFAACPRGNGRQGPVWGHGPKSISRAVIHLSKNGCSCGSRKHLPGEEVFDAVCYDDAQDFWTSRTDLVEQLEEDEGESEEEVAATGS